MEPHTYKDSDIKTLDTPVDMASFLEAIRKRPAMWLGEESIIALGAYIGGFRCAEWMYGRPFDQRFFGVEWENFERWVMDRHNPRMLSMNSLSLAQHIADSDSAGFWLWFEFYDQYRAEQEVSSPDSANA